MEHVTKGTKNRMYTDQRNTAHRTVGDGTTWIEINIDFDAKSLVFVNAESDSALWLEWSINAGTTVAGRLYGGQDFSDPCDDVTKVYIRSNEVAVNFQLFIQ